MNCKPGDLAVVVHPCKQQGRVTRCIRLATYEDMVLHGVGFPSGRPAWLVEDLFQYETRRAPLILDSYIRPLRDNPGEDETLSWAGLPKKVGEVA